jgi:hypothetical protein
LPFAAIAACNKPDASKPTGCTQGTLKLVNDSAYVFAIYFDSVFQLNMPANSIHNFTLDTGIQYFNTIRVSGSRVFANPEEQHLLITGCDTAVYYVH